MPEVLQYRIAFANDWAEGLDVSFADGVASDAVLPQSAGELPVPRLANLSALAVANETATELQVDAGVDPPAGGGFEVRRRDWVFGPGGDGDLVLRSTARSFVVPREGQIERYFVRMYDGSNPPLYSRFSSAVFANLPAGD